MDLYAACHVHWFPTFRFLHISDYLYEWNKLYVILLGRLKNKFSDGCINLFIIVWHVFLIILKELILLTALQAILTLVLPSRLFHHFLVVKFWTSFELFSFRSLVVRTASKFPQPMEIGIPYWYRRYRYHAFTGRFLIWIYWLCMFEKF